MCKISVTGLGYVGLPLAVRFSRYFEVIAFDKSLDRIEKLRTGLDLNQELCGLKLFEFLENNRFKLTNDPTDLVNANVHIVAVPTPIDSTNQPDLSLLRSASNSIAHSLKSGDIVVYESTVYPGATEEVCLPILEEISGLKCPEDFSIGYSPERINPGDEKNTLGNITKIVSGYDAITCETLAKIYEKIIQAGVYQAKSIKVAEAAKVIENTQRDLNIALMNELSIIFDRLNIDTMDVLDAARTKWNFHPFKPGLVGGHCIGVDPYYLTHKAVAVGYHPEVILAGRRINDNLYRYIVEKTMKLIHKSGLNYKSDPLRMGILGVTFKENCPDIRNSKIVSIIKEFNEYGFEPIVHDPLADPKATYEAYGLELSTWEAFENLDVLLLAVAHTAYHEIDATRLKMMLHPQSILIDIKSFFDRELLNTLNLTYWRL